MAILDLTSYFGADATTGTGLSYLTYKVQCGVRSKITICPQTWNGTEEVLEIRYGLPNCAVKKTCAPAISVQPANDHNGGSMWGRRLSSCHTASQVLAHNVWNHIQEMDAFKTSMKYTCARACGLY